MLKLLKHFTIVSSVLVGLLAISGVTAWLSREPIARYMITNWCDDSRISCDFELGQISHEGIEFSNVTVRGSDGKQGLSSAKISTRFDWPHWHSPNIATLSAEGVELTARFDETGIHLNSLGSASERLRDMFATRPLPQEVLVDGNLTLETPAGRVTGTFSGSTQPGLIDAKMQLQPGRLEAESDVLDLLGGSLDFKIEDERFTGGANISIRDAKLGPATTKDATFSGTFENSETPRLNWTLEATSLDTGMNLFGSGIQAAGVVNLNSGLRHPFVELASVIATAEADINIEHLKMGDAEIEAAVLSFSTIAAQNASKQTLFETRMSGLAERITHEKDVFETVSLDLVGETSPDSEEYVADGQFSIARGRLSDTHQNAIFEAFPPSDALTAVETNLRAAAGKALTAFAVDAGITLNLKPGEAWRVDFPQSIAIASETGAVLKLETGDASEPSFVTESGGQLAGGFSLRGGGFPNLQTDLRLARWQPDRLDLQTGELQLLPWRTEESQISAALNRLSINQSGRSLAVSALGEIAFTGALFGMDLTDTRVFGEIDARRTNSHWRAQTDIGKCLGLDIGGAKISGALQIEEIAVALCPDAGRFIREEDGVLTGTVSLGNVIVPFRSADTTGTARLDETVLTWRGGETLSLDIRTSDLDVPLSIAKRSLLLNGEGAFLSASIGEQTTINARLNGAKLSGDLVPAHVSLGQSRFSGKLVDTQFLGKAEAIDVRIQDTAADPRYQPILAELQADFDGANVTLTGPVRLARTGLIVADANFKTDLLNLAGSGSLQARELTFSPDGLQLADLSDRVRGLMANARGGLTGRADFELIGGQLTGSGALSLQDLGFDSFRAGSVDGLNGTIAFRDILSFTTPPNQHLKIGQTRLGLPLSNGDVRFQLIGGQYLDVQSATWAAGDGSISMSPMRWTLNGQSDDLQINMVDVALDDLLAGLNSPTFSATGRVSGTLPLTLGQGNAILNDGRLTSSGSGGVIRYSGEAPNSTTDENAIAFNALQEFWYSDLEIDLSGNINDTVSLAARLNGYSPLVFDGAPLDFTVTSDVSLQKLLSPADPGAAIDVSADVETN